MQSKPNRTRMIAIVGALFGFCFSGTFMILGYPAPPSIFAGLLIAVLWSLAFFSVAFLIENRARIRLNRSAHATSSVQSQGSVVLRVNATIAADLAKQAVVTATRRAKIRHQTDTFMEARTGMTFKSWGEVIRLDFEQRNSDTRVEISSRPFIPTAVFDFAKNQENVDAIIRYLKRSESEIRNE